MLFGNRNIKKAVSSVLLLVLLLIHSVKLLHSHSSNAFSSKEIHQHGSLLKNSADCSICNYQLAKDIDDSFLDQDGMPVIVPFVSGAPLLAFYKSVAYSAFESRGPPCAI